MNNKSRLVIPPLPTLPKRTSSLPEKENVVPPSRSNIHKDKAKHQVGTKHKNAIKPSTSRLVESNNDYNPNDSATSNSSFSTEIEASTLMQRQQVNSSPSTSIVNLSVTMTPSRSNNRVLRSNETVESFFCLADTCDQRHRALCEDIANDVDGAANNVKIWRKVLEFASESVSLLSPQKREMTNAGTNLIRLHKRATSRFSSIDCAVNGDNDKEHDLLWIWLLYAKSQLKNGLREEARSTYQHIQNMRIGGLDSHLYVALADFEMDNHGVEDKRGLSNIEKAMQYIETGITRGSIPSSLLHDYKKALKSKGEGVAKYQDKPSVIKPIKAKESAFGKIPPMANRSHKVLKHRIQSQEVESDKKKEADEKSSHLLRTKAVTAPKGARAVNSLEERSKESSMKIRAAVAEKRRNLLSRKRLGGGAQRIAATITTTKAENGVVNDDDDIGSNKEDDQFKRLKTEHFNQKEKKITKADLSYMLEWKPSRPGNKPNSSNMEETSKVGSSDHQTGFRPPMEKIEEASMTKESVSICTSTNSNQSSTGTRSTNGSYNEKSDASEKTATQDLSVDVSQSFIKTTPSCQANPHFLPLVDEKNIITVKKMPFLKLGVIGSGGSCKVYRVLARDKSIVAIKKVKIGGMSKKAVEGYANEIALLRRLHGNPAIIQLYDSEVDFQRKALFLVMELGEVDLNYVLQQQGLQHSNDTKDCSSLNLNFIRLTWQQMLSAVHCIHEERIIHGDLKPANFLFVKGALKLIDFGIAKAIQCDDTVNIYRENQSGTLNYMSPESLVDTGSGQNGAKIKCGRPSDVWSLGCILYQMCYGKTPFAHLQMVPKLQAIINPHHEISFPKSIDRTAIDAMQQCLKWKPDSRAPIVGIKGLLNEHCFLHSDLSHQQN